MDTEEIFATEALVGLLHQSMTFMSDDEAGKFSSELFPYLIQLFVICLKPKF